MPQQNPGSGPHQPPPTPGKGWERLNAVFRFVERTLQLVRDSVADAVNRTRAELRFRQNKGQLEQTRWTDPHGRIDVGSASYTDMFEMELLAIDTIDKDDERAIKARAKQVKQEYYVLLNDRWMTAAEQQEDDKNLPSSKEEIISLLVAVQRMRQKRAALGLVRNWACGMAVVIALVSLVFLTYLIYQLGNDTAAQWCFTTPGRIESGTDIIFAACLIGGLGGLVSTVSRTFSLRWSGEVLYGNQNVKTLGHALVLNILIAFIEGFIFSFVLYALFQSGIVGGTIFPQFKSTVAGGAAGCTGASLIGFLGSLPCSPGDVAKVIVWSFLAGFSERLVPDLLTQFQKQAAERGAASGR